MDVRIEYGDVRLEGDGVELLKIKTQLVSRLGVILKSQKNVLTFPLSALPAVIDLLPQQSCVSEINHAVELFEKHASARLKALSLVEDEAPKKLPYGWSEILDPAQESAVAAMTLPDILGLCLFDEQGSGKTVMSIAAFDILKRNDQVDALIVLCPKTMMSEWPKDIGKFSSNRYEVMIADGDKRKKYETALSKFDVLIANYEGVEPMLVTLAASSSTRRYLLVADESFYVKNSEALRAEVASKLRAACIRCFVLCGTPAPNSAHDLINQFNLADSGFTFGAFKKSKDVTADLPKINELIDLRGLFIRRLKSEILKHVPEKNFHIVRVLMQGKQALMYERARSELALELRGLNNEKFKKQLVSYFQKRSALLQICATPGSIDPTFEDVPAKYLVLDGLLSRLVSEGRKVIVWSFYKKSLEDLERRYAAYKPVRVDGSISPVARREAVKSFQENPSTMLFVGNPAAAGAGITLHASYDAVYLSYSNQAAHYLQSLDRIHRRGQTADHVNYYLLVCDGTVEETEVVRLRGKELAQHALLGDNIQWPTSLDAALGELNVGGRGNHG